METLVAALAGLGLAAACGFRIFVPMLVAGTLSRLEWVDLPASGEWMGSTVALIVLGTATALEVGAYFIPWVDNLLDTVSTPASAIAGTVVALPFLADLHPALEWTIAIVAGGGAATTVQAGAALIRGGSTATTGGIGNPLVSLGELAGSLVTSVLALLIPVIAAVALLGLITVFGVWWLRRPGSDSVQPS